MDNLTNLLFELSSTERLAILNSLKDEEQKLSHIAQYLELSLPECSRHLQRLLDVKLIVRASNGVFSISSYGILALNAVKGLNFLSEHDNYFLSHDLSFLPNEFINRLGELSAGSLAQDMVTGIQLVDLLYTNTEEYAWVMSDQVIVNVMDTIRQKIGEGIRFRSIFPEVFSPPPGYTPSVGPIRRTLPSVNMRLLVNEKEALVCFPQTDGRVDYAPFTGKDSSFIKWCSDLFEYYWNMAKPSESILLNS